MKLCDRVSLGRTFIRVLLKQWVTYTVGKIFMRQSILLGHFLCDGVQGVERFVTHHVTSLVKYPLPPGCQKVILGYNGSLRRFSDPAHSLPVSLLIGGLS